MLAIPLAKKCDRKTLLGISALGVSACLFTLGAFYYLKTYADVDGFGWIALLDFLIYIGFFMVNIPLYIAFKSHLKFWHVENHKYFKTRKLYMEYQSFYPL